MTGRDCAALAAPRPAVAPARGVPPAREPARTRTVPGGGRRCPSCRAHPGVARVAFGLATALATALAVALPGEGLARPAWPVKPVRIVVPLAPGGGTDTVVRVIGARLAEVWGQGLVVDNRAGGGQVIGTELVARAAPDGHTLLAITPAHVINPVLHEKLAYRWDRDFAPIGNLAATANVLVVHPSLPVKTTKELIALVRARPGQLHYGSSGVGGASHLAFELFNAMAGLDAVHVPYKGGSLAVQDVLAGRISLIMGNMPSVLQHVRAGRLRPLAVASAKRSALLPGVPTIAESALPGYEATNWNGLVAPAGMPAELVNRVNGDIVRVLGEAPVRERLSSGGFDPIGDTPALFAATLKREFDRWERVIRSRGIRID